MSALGPLEITIFEKTAGFLKGGDFATTPFERKRGKRPKGVKITPFE
jgi:hypothetical protein